MRTSAKQVGARLRAFRDGLYISRTSFATALQIGGERLACYEAGRAPVKGFVIEAASLFFGLNQKWLLTGKGNPIGDPGVFVRLANERIRSQARRAQIDAGFRCVVCGAAAVRSTYFAFGKGYRLYLCEKHNNEFMTSSPDTNQFWADCSIRYFQKSASSAKSAVQPNGTL